VIDAGWYAEEQDWFESVGEWEPAKWRFPSGFKTMLDTIREHGMIPGVWVEPEVIGIRSPVAKQLPEECFFQQGGKRVVERGRYQLDWRNSLVRERLSKVIDTLITEYGVGYFKFDYNIEVISGSDIGPDSSTGSAHLSHQRAYLAWVATLLDKYPKLVIENCSSGAQRMDYASLSVHTLQSTSDQQDPKLYATVSAAIPTAVIPEQSASWAYPQAEWSDEINALTVVNTLLGRVHLSGRVDKLNKHQVTLIAEGMTVYKSIRQEIKSARPIWPFGFPSWHDDWLALALALENGDFLLSVWRRGGSTSRKVPLPLRTKHHGQAANVRVLYPSASETVFAINEAVLDITLPDAVCARLLRVSCTPCN
jgi:alpha-galactosidase